MDYPAFQDIMVNLLHVHVLSLYGIIIWPKFDFQLDSFLHLTWQIFNMRTYAYTFGVIFNLTVTLFQL